MAFKAHILKQLTIPLRQLGADREHYLRPVSEIFRGHNREDSEQEAPFLMNVHDMETGALEQIIVPAVLKNRIEEDCPNYDKLPENQGLHIRFLGKKQTKNGKNLNLFYVALIETDGEIEDEPEKPQSHKKPKAA